MVERLKIAVAKARAARERSADPTSAMPPEGAGNPGAPSPGEPQLSVKNAAAAWEALEPVALDPAHLERQRIITHGRKDVAHVAFDVLRTRILQVFQKHGWTRLGITSPDKGCGKTFVAANLALSMSRQPDICAVLMDLDLRAPGLAKVLGIARPEPISWFLRGDIQSEEYLHRAGHNLALGLNGERVRDAAELILAPQTALALDAMRRSLVPDIVIYDLPPMLSCDDVLGFLPQLDCVLLVIGGGRTRPGQVAECERLLADQTHLLGVLLNQAEGADPTRYTYE